MKFTNKLGLPGPLAKALSSDDYTLAGGDISVTGLIKSPRQRQLELRHDAEIEVDVSTRVWLLLGKAVHYVLEKAGYANAFLEETFVEEIDGVKVKGQSDVFNWDGVLWDYKVSSAFAFKEVKSEWEAQLNFYALFWHLAGFDVKALRIAGIVRDWRWSEWQRDKGNYPDAAATVLEIPLWPAPTAARIMRERVKLHKAAADLPDDQLPLCSDGERWAKPEAWAVKKEGGKAAIRGGVCSTQDEATGLAKARNEAPENKRKRGGGTKAVYFVEHRPGANIRCERYCNAAPFCNQWAKLKPPEVAPNG